MNAIIFSMLVFIVVFLVFIVIDRRKDNKALYDAIELLTSKQTKSVKDYVEHAAKVNNDSMVESSQSTKDLFVGKIQTLIDSIHLSGSKSTDKIIKTIEQQVQSMDQSNCNAIADIVCRSIDEYNKTQAEFQKMHKPKATNKTTDKATVNFKKDNTSKKQKAETKNEAKNS